MNVRTCSFLLLLLAGCPSTIGGGPGGDDDDGGIDPKDPDGGPGRIDSGPIGPIDGLGPWTGDDNVAWSQDPPFGLPVDRVPQFVSFGFDDNAYSGLEGSAGTGGFSWAVDMAKSRRNPAGSGNARTYDGEPIKHSFYLTSVYIAAWQSESPTFVKRAWHEALIQGHDMGNHTQGHLHGAGFDKNQWGAEIQTALDWATKPFDPAEVNFSPDDSKGAGIPRDQIYGFRTPFLEYNDATFEVLREKGFWMDLSIEEGWDAEFDGRNYNWPYTLDDGSPGNEVLAGWDLMPPKPHLGSHPGLWELAAHPVIVPPDSECAKYGVPTGLRDKMHALASWFSVESGKITGLDYNLFVQFKMTKAEFLATMKYTLDLRLEGNRAPMTFGAHSDVFSSKYTAAPNATVDERQQAIEEFIDYALSKPEVRVVSGKQLLDWVRNPVPLP